MINYRKKTWIMLLGLFVAVFLFTFLTGRFKDDNQAQAANAWAFDPGYIISDWQMTNYNSMSEAEIQSFLTAKNPCDNRDWNLYQQQSSWYPNVKWNWKDGHFVCLSQERFGDGMTIGSGDTAAHIIWQTAQDYKINPQVLIVLLEKENGLITDTFPHSGQYKTAAGFGCPDTAACDSKYFGFKNQLRQAAALFREVMNGGWTNYPVGNNYVQYNPNRDCGGTTVNIRNRATSALYRYTPYQPNWSALNAGYGLGDGCGAYGNRNFYLWFEDWFGGVKNDGYPMPQSSDVAEGLYVFRSALNEGKVMDVASQGVTNGTNVQIWNNNASVAQKWQVKNNGDGTYTLKNPNSGKVLDVAEAGRINETNVQLYESNGSCAQKWKIAKNGDNTYTFYSSCSGLVLDIKSANTANGANLQIYAPNGTNAQKWTMRAVPTNTNIVLDDGVYTVESMVKSQKVVDIKNGADTAQNGTNVQIWGDNETEAQKWQITRNNDGTYTIVNPYSQKAIDVNSAGDQNYSNVQVYNSNGSCAQKWLIEKNKDNSYTFLSECSNRALDVLGAGTDNGTNIQIYTSNGSNAQKWQLEKVKDDLIPAGVYVVESAIKSGVVMDVSGAGMANYTNVQIWQKNGTEAQRWQIKKNSDGTYTFINPMSKRALDVAAAGTVNYTNVDIYDSNGTCAQKWKVQKNNDGTFTFISTCSGNKALDVSGAGTANGTNIQIYTANGTGAQKWWLRG